jgi:dolichol-phosphate mannosyltransferase
MTTSSLVDQLRGQLPGFGTGCELMVIMPVYNEQASLRKEVLEWFQEIENWTSRFIFVAIDDGSIDNSLLKLQQLQCQLGSRLEMVSRSNKGHGQTCIEGYRMAIERGIPFVFQIDSDGQCDPQYFHQLWRKRENYDVIYGYRKGRDDGYRRILASALLKLSILLIKCVWCVDANAPYRLMRTETLHRHLPEIPSDFVLANVALAVLLKKDRTLRHHAVPIHFRERYGGEPSVPFAKFGVKALELFGQLRDLRG